MNKFLLSGLIFFHLITNPLYSNQTQSSSSFIEKIKKKKETIRTGLIVLGIITTGSVLLKRHFDLKTNKKEIKSLKKERDNLQQEKENVSNLLKKLGGKLIKVHQLVPKFEEMKKSYAWVRENIQNEYGTSEDTTDEIFLRTGTAEALIDFESKFVDFHQTLHEKFGESNDKN